MSQIQLAVATQLHESISTPVSSASCNRLSDGLIVRCQVSEREVYYSLAPSKINENPELFDSISDLLTTSIPLKRE